MFHVLNKEEKVDDLQTARMFLRSLSSEPQDVDDWLAIRREAGQRIDPKTAEVCWTYAQVIDPYSVLDPFPEEADCVGRKQFARSPGSDVWVYFGDIPEAIRNELWAMHKQSLAFPAGLNEAQEAVEAIDSCDPIAPTKTTLN